MNKNKKYFEVTVSYGNFNKLLYVDAENEENAKNVVKNFKTISQIATSRITKVKEIGFEEYTLKKAEIEQIKKNYKNFEIVLSVPSQDSNSFNIKYFYSRAIDEKSARENVERCFPYKGMSAQKFILSVHELEYAEFKERREKNLAHFYRVAAKCGHVGDRRFYPVNFYVFAKSKNDAAKMVKDFPRVKKGKTCSPIISVDEITKDEYEAGKKEMDENLFLHHDKLTSDEQKILNNLVEQNTQAEVYKTKRKQMFFSKYNDEAFEEELKQKKYKQTKKKYVEDAGMHLNKSLKYGKILEIDSWI